MNYNKPVSVSSLRVKLALQPSKSLQHSTTKSSLLKEDVQKIGWSVGISMSSSKHLKPNTTL